MNRTRLTPINIRARTSTSLLINFFSLFLKGVDHKINGFGLEVKIPDSIVNIFPINTSIRHEVGLNYHQPLHRQEFNERESVFN